MKANQISSKLVSQLFVKRITDQSAETIKEICNASGYGRSKAYESINKMVESGKVEKVWKKEGNQIVPAYRLPK